MLALASILVESNSTVYLGLCIAVCLGLAEIGLTIAKGVNRYFAQPKVLQLFE